jgi:hypothetical protein
MAQQLSAKEQLAQVCRMRVHKPWIAPETVIEAALRTPTVTRFIKAKQMRLQREASASALNLPHTTRMTDNHSSLTEPAQTKKTVDGDVAKVRLIA